MCKPDSPAQAHIKQAATDKMTRELSHKPEILDSILPKNFGIGCRRLTPGPGFLQALGSDNVEHVRSQIKEITEDAIMDVDGKERKVDAIICATGFDNSFGPRFHLEGRDGHIIGKDFVENPRGYLAMALEDMPNYFVMYVLSSPLA